MSPALLVALAALAAAPAPSADARWGLRWVSPKDCVQPAGLARAVEGRLGRSVFGPDAEFTVDGVLEPDEAPRWRARLALVDARGTVLGTREVTSDGKACADIDDALSLVVAVMIDPRAALGPLPEAQPTPPPAPPVEPPPVPPPPSLPTVSYVPPPPPPSREDARFEWLFAGAGSLGLGLSPTVGGQLLWLAKPERAPAWEWWMTLWPRSELNLDGGAGAVLAWQSGLAVCPVVAGGDRLLFTACAGLAATLMSAHAQGYQQWSTTFLGRPDAVLRARLRVGLGGFALALAVVGGAGPLRPRMRLLLPSGASEDVPVGGYAWGGLELSIGALFR